MDIIPVIDLKGGAVVRARAGARAHYAPIETPLAPTSRPRDIVAGFLALYPFRKIYIADLAAITRVGDHAAVIAELEDTFPDIEFWVDSELRLRPKPLTGLVSTAVRSLSAARAWTIPRRVLRSFEPNRGACCHSISVAMSFRGQPNWRPMRCLASTHHRHDLGQGRHG